MDKLTQFLDRGLEKRNKCRFFVSQAILTPTQSTVIENLFSSLKNTLAKSCDDCIVSWLKTCNKGDLNIVIIDFVENNHLLDEIIELNSA